MKYVCKGLSQLRGARLAVARHDASCSLAGRTKNVFSALGRR